MSAWLPQQAVDWVEAQAQALNEGRREAPEADASVLVSCQQVLRGGIEC